jgi:hypothetical protein
MSNKPIHRTLNDLKMLNIASDSHYLTIQFSGRTRSAATAAWNA